MKRFGILVKEVDFIRDKSLILNRMVGILRQEVLKYFNQKFGRNIVRFRNSHKAK